MKLIKIHIPVFVSIAITVSCLLGVGLWFNKDSSRIIENSVRNGLEELCRTQAATFATRLHDQLVTLETQSQYFENVDMDDFEEIRKVITSMKNLGLFKVVGVADKRGHSVDYNNFEFENAGYDYFVETMRGKPSISQTVIEGTAFGEAMVISVPINQTKNETTKTEGVFYGIFTKDELEKIIEGFNFEKDRASLLLSADGFIIARSKNPVLVTDRIANFFDLGTSWGINGTDSLESLKLDLEKNQSVMIPYETGTKKRVAIMAPIGVHDWYYAIVTHQNVITDISKNLSTHVVYIEIILSLAFGMLMISILFLIKNNDLINRTNEKFTMATKQNQTVVFDFNYERKTVEFNGDTAFIAGKQVDSVSGDHLGELKKYIHEDDFPLIEAIRGAEFGDLFSITREFRLKCFDDHYYWYKMIGNFVRDEENRATRFIGNLVNVDEIVNKEMLLQQRAEKDTLTGLLNKGSFQTRVEKTLASSGRDDLYAFYIIDLDNFKQVNDLMGHIAGDKVLSDTAQKLCVIFSEQDFVGRIGGDEFTAFLKLSSDGRRFAEKIISEKAKLICEKLNEVYSDGSIKVNVSASVGIALYPEHGVSYSELYKNSDLSLYFSKNNGKNQFHIFQK